MARPKGDQAATAARRQAILDAALQIFGAGGFNGGTLKQVSEMVGISEAGILHHFKTKSQLLLAVLEHRDELSNDWFNDTISNSLAFATDWLLLLEYTILSGEATSQSHPAYAYFQERYETVRIFSEANMKGIHRDGCFKPGTPDAHTLAVMLTALSDGLQVQWLLDRSINMLSYHEKFWEQYLTTDAWNWVQADRAAKAKFTDPEVKLG
jgi:AcrR family transcriptional regulator